MNYLEHASTPRQSSLAPSDKLARGLGFYSLGLGLVELLAPRAMTRALGMEGSENLVRAYGAREIASGIGVLSDNPVPALWSRVAGDALDLATLATALSDDNPKKGNVKIAMAVVLATALVDVMAAKSSTALHVRPRRMPIVDYSDRTGFPKPAEAMRGAAKDFETPPDMRADIGTGQRLEPMQRDLVSRTPANTDPVGQPPAMNNQVGL
ncbi:hypothetical protein IQ22_03063 [Pseudomonas duriflava]|uniref:Cyclase dehydrase n=1 Tax=Pseudomonas duriflava TaxID=459528 RepID=A0A562Q7G6_9PSED|nr:DUF4267 domain-containing protein [Pseudomonas duriflava]TWI52687.1 hypothetical protein IQ22_03063 [Pseudomonas duriflava]